MNVKTSQPGSDKEMEECRASRCRVDADLKSRKKEVKNAGYQKNSRPKGKEDARRRGSKGKKFELKRSTSRPWTAVLARAYCNRVKNGEIPVGQIFDQVRGDSRGRELGAVKKVSGVFTGYHIGRREDTDENGRQFSQRGFRVERNRPPKERGYRRPGRVGCDQSQ